jgi:hypothetical protein
VSLFSGLATFGGFWTFVNGAFALFFGANVVYFAFGKLIVFSFEQYLTGSIQAGGRFLRSD